MGASNIPQVISAMLDSQLFWGVISLILAAIALSGKLSMSASGVLLAAAWIVGCIGLYKAGVIRDWYTILACWFFLGGILTLIAAWILPPWLVRERELSVNDRKSFLEEVQDPTYRDLVAEVIQSLDPEAHVAVGNAIDGPDGFRRVDVEVRSSENKLIVVDIIDRPDGRKIGVESVDQADSKRKDIKADTMIICSNTGFDETAIRKAKRMHIGLIAVVKQGDQRVKAIIQEEIYLRIVNMAPASVTWRGATNADDELLRQYAKSTHDVAFDGKSVANWLQHRAALIVMFNPTIQYPLIATFSLKNPTKFSVQGHSVTLRAMEIRFHPHIQWLSQVVELDAKSAIYNYIRGRFVLGPGPNQLIIRGINFETATPMTSPPPVADLGFGLLPGEIEIYAKLLMVVGLDIPKNMENTIPKLDNLINPEDLSLKVAGIPPEEIRGERSASGGHTRE